MSMQSALPEWSQPLMPLVALGLLGGCSNELLMTNYAVAPSSPALVSEVRRGAQPVSAAFRGSPCVLTVDNNVRPITSQKSGTLGQPGFNVIVSSTNPSNAVTSNPPGCPAISNLTINMGSGSEVLDVGSTTTSGGVQATVDGTDFSTGLADTFFSATITGRNEMQDTVSGRFEAIASGPPSADPHAPPPPMFVAEGSFNIR